MLSPLTVYFVEVEFFVPEAFPVELGNDAPPRPLGHGRDVYSISQSGCGEASQALLARDSPTSRRNALPPLGDRGWFQPGTFEDLQWHAVPVIADHNGARATFKGRFECYCDLVRICVVCVLDQLCQSDDLVADQILTEGSYDPGTGSERFAALIGESGRIEPCRALPSRSSASVPAFAAGREDAVDQRLELASACVEAERLADRLQLRPLEPGEHVGEVDAPATDDCVDVVLDHPAVANLDREVIRELAQAVAAEHAESSPLLFGLQSLRGHGVRRRSPSARCASDRGSLTHVGREQRRRAATSQGTAGTADPSGSSRLPRAKDAGRRWRPGTVIQGRRPRIRLSDPGTRPLRPVGGLDSRYASVRSVSRSRMTVSTAFYEATAHGIR